MSGIIESISDVPPPLKLNGHNELVTSTPALSRAEEVLGRIRSARGELKEVLTPQVQEEGIYANPEIFVLFEFIRQGGAEPQELKFYLDQFTRNIELAYGSGVLFLGSGWGLTGRSLCEARPDLKVTHVDVNSDIVAMDRFTNATQGFSQISSVVGDAVSRDDLSRIFDAGTKEIATVGLLRYLDETQREAMLTNLLELAPPGTSFLMREVNAEAVQHVREFLHNKGVGYHYEAREVSHLRYTRLFAYYFMYHEKEPLRSEILKTDPDFDFAEFRAVVDSKKDHYPQIDTAKIFGEVSSPPDLRHLLVLADLAGHELKREEVVVFHN